MRNKYAPSADFGSFVFSNHWVLLGGDDLCPEPYVIEFSCENNRSVLSLSVGSSPEIQRYNFSVELNSIDYEKQTFRIFDPGVQKNNCSTLPVYPLSPYYYNFYYQPGTYYGMEIDPDAGSLVFVSCKNPVKPKYPLYVDTDSCNITANQFSKMKAPSNYYSYVVVGESVVASDIEESCTVYKTAPVDLRRLPNVTAGDISLQDIHNLLSNGLELSWYARFDTSRRRKSLFCKYTDLKIY
ncbi:uncharacterized protein [Coffea arabica]|uniref:LEAF RUST 10 DISEASE-RESISTANCE LOCUS RECEPTOR-LIKE PROTEIN KINASE-like 1.2 n=1 Tax=Coffea arabica TaxID=13443 RepID=A0ABM4V399_COFAR